MKISRQVRMNSSRIRTHIIFTSQSEIAKVMRITAIARGLAPGGMAGVFASGAGNRQTTSGKAASGENAATTGRSTRPPAG